MLVQLADSLQEVSLVWLAPSQKMLMLASTVDRRQVDQAIVTLSQGNPGCRTCRVISSEDTFWYLVDEMVINILQLSSCVLSFDHTCKKALNDRL